MAGPQIGKTFGALPLGTTGGTFDPPVGTVFETPIDQCPARFIQPHTQQGNSQRQVNGTTQNPSWHVFKIPDFAPSWLPVKIADNMGNLMRSTWVRQQLGRQARLAWHQDDLAMATRLWLSLSRESDAVALLARYRLGQICQRQGHFTQAQAWFYAAHVLVPDWVLAMYALGSLARKQHQWELACQWLERGVAIAPHLGLLWNAWGESLEALGQSAEAGRAYHQAWLCQPKQPGFAYNWGRWLLTQGQARQARPLLVQATQGLLRWAPAWDALGQACLYDRAAGEAVGAFRQAWDLTHDRAYISLLARAQAQAGQVDEAWATWQQMATLSSGDLFRRAQLLPIISASLAESEAWFAHMENQVRALQTAEVRLHDPWQEVNATPFYVAYHDRPERALLEDLASAYLRACPDLGWQAPHCVAPQFPLDRPLRVGWCSRHLYAHTVRWLTADIPLAFDPARFSVTLLPFAGDPQDEAWADLQRRAPETLRLPRDWRQARQAIADQGFDILIYPDLGLDSLTWFLAFARLAPVQVTTLGHPVTTGIPNLDLYISSVALDPPGNERFYSEQLVRLSQMVCLCTPRRAPRLMSRAEVGLPEQGRIYLCAQSLYKLHPDMDPLVAGILRRDPEALCVFAGGGEPQWEQRLRLRWRYTLGDLQTRCWILPKLSPEDFLGLYPLAAVGLDPRPFGGGHTSYEAFAAGLPVITWPTGRLKGRVTAALYQQMGGSELVVDSAEAYMNMAVRVATDPALQAKYRRQIEAGHPLIFNQTAMVREFEDVLAAFWATKAGVNKLK
jgi:protein O-GlcNAc transferase